MKMVDKMDLMLAMLFIFFDFEMSKGTFVKEKTAKSFLSFRNRRAVSVADLTEECYEKNGCSYEEVIEVFGTHSASVEFMKSRRCYMDCSPSNGYCKVLSSSNFKHIDHVDVLCQDLTTTSTVSQSLTTVATTLIADPSVTTSVDPIETTTVKYDTTSDKTTDANPSDITSMDPIAKTTMDLGTTSSSNTCMCTCTHMSSKWSFLIGSNYTIDELKDLLKDDLIELTKELSVDVKTLSSTKNKKISASDSRTTVEQIGWIGIIVIIMPVLLIVIIDCSRLLRH